MIRIVADRSREALCERRAPRCERGCESLLTSPTGPHGGAVAGDLNAGFDVDGFIARIDSGEIDQTQHCGQNVSDLEDGQPVAEAAVFAAAMRNC